MKKKQKILPLGIMFIMALAVFMIPSFRASAQEFTSGDWNYEVNEGYYDGQAVLTGYVGSANNIKIPETIDEKKLRVYNNGTKKPHWSSSNKEVKVGSLLFKAFIS